MNCWGSGENSDIDRLDNPNGGRIGNSTVALDPEPDDECKSRDEDASTYSNSSQRLDSATLVDCRQNLGFRDRGGGLVGLHRNSQRLLTLGASCPFSGPVIGHAVSLRAGWAGEGNHGRLLMRRLVCRRHRNELREGKNSLFNQHYDGFLRELRQFSRGPGCRQDADTVSGVIVLSVDQSGDSDFTIASPLVSETCANLQQQFGTLIRRRRLAAGLGQEPLADKVGLHHTHVSLLGKRMPSLQVVKKLATALGTTAAALPGPWSAHTADWVN